MMKNYYRLATEVDSTCGKVLDELKKQGVLDNTLVIFTTDNGYYHAEHGLADKWYPHQESIRVPLIIRDPRMPEKKHGSTNNDFTLRVDLAPTILSAAGLATLEAMQGRDIAPLYLADEKPEWRKEFFYEHPTITSTTRIPSSEALVRKDWKYFLWPDFKTEQLFDLRADPREHMARLRVIHLARRPQEAGFGGGGVDDEPRVDRDTMAADAGAGLEDFHARVAIRGTNLETLTDALGEYRVAQVPAGSLIEVSASFADLEPQTVPVRLTPGQVLRQDFALARREKRDDGSVVVLDVFTVKEREMNGQAIALQERRTAPNLKNVISTETLGDPLGGSMGDFLRFLPGVSAAYGALETEGVLIRVLVVIVVIRELAVVKAVRADVVTHSRDILLCGPSLSRGPLVIV